MTDEQKNKGKELAKCKARIEEYRKEISNLHKAIEFVSNSMKYWED